MFTIDLEQAEAITSRMILKMRENRSVVAGRFHAILELKNSVNTLSMLHEEQKQEEEVET